MHVDFQVLHDAFFKYATKPPMSTFGDVYYEGKEHEEKARLFKPGQYTQKLREALSILLPSHPPPWIMQMQRFGPPPSYPNLRVPGVNAALPAGAQWGVHMGGWGKPPTDAFGNPLFPSVFGSSLTSDQTPKPINPVKPTFWGEPVEIDEDEEDEELEDQEGETSEEEAVAATDDSLAGDGTQTVMRGTRSVFSGTKSVMSGAYTPMSSGAYTPMQEDVMRLFKEPQTPVTPHV